MNNRHMAFYLEALILVAAFAVVIAVVTRGMAAARTESLSAQRQTDAVCLAKNAAESVAASDSLETLFTYMNETGNAQRLDDSVEARYNADMAPDASGSYLVTVSWEPRQTEAGTLVSSTITVNYGDKAVYSLSTAVYLSEHMEAHDEAD